MGIVYKARQVELNRLVALKVMIAGEYATPPMLERFQREARAAAKLRHPNLVEIYDVSREGEKHYFTMRYVDGTPLSDLIRRKEVPPRRALEIVRKVALALDHAHSQGVVHRDVKPANILVDRAGEPHLTDFGLARDATAGDLTQPGTSLGTPSYSAPEQVSGEHTHADARSDVYAIGATLYEALAGRPPFQGDTAWEVVVRVLSREPQPIRELNPSVHRDIETICLKALEKEPSRRYATAGEMAEDIRRYMDGEPIVAHPASLTDRAWKRIRRNPPVSALAAVALLAGALAGWAAWQGHKRDLEAEGARRAMVEARLRELSRSGRALVDAALARRSTGDLKGCARYAKGLAEPVEELICLAPNLAEPWYYRGRMEAATGGVEEAERSQSRAVELASRPDATPGSREVLLLARYERGVLRASFYQRALGEAQVQLLRARASEGEGAERRMPEVLGEATVESEVFDGDPPRARGGCGAARDLVHLAEVQLPRVIEEGGPDRAGDVLERGTSASGGLAGQAGLEGGDDVAEALAERWQLERGLGQAFEEPSLREARMTLQLGAGAGAGGAADQADVEGLEEVFVEGGGDLMEEVRPREGDLLEVEAAVLGLVEAFGERPGAGEGAGGDADEGASRRPCTSSRTP